MMDELKTELNNITNELSKQNSENNPEIVSTLIKRAKLYQKLGHLNEAKNDLQTALQREPNNNEAIDTLQQLMKTGSSSSVATTVPNKDENNTTIDDLEVKRLREFISTTLADPSDTKKIKAFVSSPDFIKVLTVCGSPPSQDNTITPDLRAVSFMILTKLFNPGQDYLENKDRNNNQSAYPLTFIIEQCAACFSHCLGTGKNTDKLLAYRTLHALFQTNITVGASILCQEGIVEDMMDVIDFEILDVQLAIMDVLSIGSSDTSCRKLIIKHASSWLAKTAATKDEKKDQLKAIAATTLTKLHGQLSMQSNNNQQQSEEDQLDSSLEKAMKGVNLNNDNLVDNFKKIITSQSTLHMSMVMNAIEGLAYSSMDPGVKESLANDSTFLKSLTALTIHEASKQSNPLLFGIGTIFLNITMYRPVLSEQQKQMKKLRDLANAKKTTNNNSNNKNEEDVREQDKAVDQRVQKLVDDGCSMALLVLSKNNSLNIRTVAAQTYLNLVTPQTTRGKLLQQGIVKGLLPLAVISKAMEEEKEGGAGYRVVAAQALAKLAITTNPSLAFTPEQSLDLVKPFLNLCKDESQLRQFEGLMALTNMASMDDHIRDKIDKEDGMSLFENLQLSSNDMVQRAATEMVCNMTFCESVFDRYTDVNKPGAQNKIRLLMILSDHEDVATRKAASGALAILGNHPGACIMMKNVDKGYERISKLLDHDETIEVQHRGIEIIRCMVNHLGKEVVEHFVQLGSVDKKLVEIVKNCQVNAVRGAAMEVLKLLVNNGVQLKA
ncbi:unnamed protein product [Cunninghamella echinulata]